MPSIEFQGKTYAEATDLPIPKVKSHRAFTSGRPLPPIFRVPRDGKSYIIYKENTLIPCSETVRLMKQLALGVRQLSEKDPTHPVTVGVLGVGSGVDVITLADKLSDKTEEGSSHVRLIGTDISGSALTSAELNARINNIHGFQLRKRDMLEGLVREFGKFDVIFFNPPYIPSDAKTIVKFTKTKPIAPRDSIDGGRDGLDYIRALYKDAKEVLTNRGIIMTQHMDFQSETVRRIAYSELRGISVQGIETHPGKGFSATIAGHPQTIQLFNTAIS